ncbi:hypothetical protein ONZ45_g14724 [Pleurotus djamor]|nr:hypothetical protein ONZ45_g14724 [Pleurotus djamor]
MCLLSPPVVGINLGNTYASIAVFTKEGLAECIANEDGERQIACAVSFHGEETYIGNQAKHQLVKNSKNTIIGFRNLLGKKFSELPKDQPTTSAPVIQHPTIADEPAYKVEVLQAAPSPLPPSTATNTPAASIAPTPRSEPTPAERILTVSEVATIFIKSLVQSAEDFLGRKVQGAVITVPSWFTDAQKTALSQCTSEAGVQVLQLLDEASATLVTTTSEAWSSDLSPDRTQLIVDLGSSSLALSLVSIRQGLGHIIASSSSTSVGADQLDNALIKFFAADFTKKTKTLLTVAPATELLDRRAEAKLLLAIEHTKRTISASPGAATCSVESLKDGLDYTGTINRLRFDMIAKPIYTAVSNATLDLLKDAGLDAYHVDEIVYVGGTSCLPGLDEHLTVAGGFDEGIVTPFSSGIVVGGGVGDPTTILARGCAVQASVISSLPDDEGSNAIKAAYAADSPLNAVSATSKTLGLLFPGESEEAGLGGTWIPVAYSETPLPARRTVQFDVGLTESSKKIACEVWEVTESIRIEKIKPPKEEYSDDEDAEEDEEDEIDVKHKTLTKDALVGVIELEAKLGIQAKGKGPAAGTWSTTVQVQFIIGEKGSLDVTLKEVGPDGASSNLKIGDSPPVNAFNTEYAAFHIPNVPLLTLKYVISFWTQYSQVFERISREGSDVRAVVLASANPKLFTAGLDLNATSTLNSNDSVDPARRALELREHILEFQHAIGAPERCPVPVIVAVHGLALGLGIDIIGYCDIRFASSNATFAIKEVDVGLAADIGTLSTIPKVTGNESLVRELAFSGRNFSAMEAEKLGLLSRIVEGSKDEVVAAALNLAKLIASKSPVAVVGTKHLLLHSRDHSVAQSLAYTATWNSAGLQARDTPDSIAAVRAKKQPNYQPLRKVSPKL